MVEGKHAKEERKTRAAAEARDRRRKGESGVEATLQRLGRVLNWQTRKTGVSEGLVGQCPQRS